MRDPKRINTILGLINNIWQFDQDMRFMQLLYWLQSEYVSKTNCHGKVEEIREDRSSTIGYDLFHVEDDKFIEFLKDFLKEREQRQRNKNKV